MAYIKQQKFKEALFDCEQALVLNANFSKAHMRAFTCYSQQGELAKASESLQKAIALGDETGKKQEPWIAEMIKQESFAEKAFERREFREALFYFKKLTENCTESVKHTARYIETMVSDKPNDMTDPISYSTKVQNKFIEQPEFLYWRGRVLIYNGQTDMGKKHIKQALNTDPDCARYQKYWKNLQKADKKKAEAAECFAAGIVETAIALYEECMEFDPLNSAFN